MKQLLKLFVFSVLLSSIYCTKNNSSGSQSTWTTKTPMKFARHHLTFVEVNGMFYAIGGYNISGMQEVEVYNPATDTWTTKSPMPTARGYMAAAVVSGKIYVIGGITGPDLNNITYTNVTEVYDPATDQWSEKAAFPISPAFNNVLGNQFITGEALDGKIYVAAGPEQPTFIYDPVSDNWSTDSALAIGKFNFEQYFSTAVNNEMYVNDGMDFLKFSLSENQWELLQPNGVAMRGAALASDGSNVFSVGGYDNNTNTNSITADVEKYSIENSAWISMPAMNVKKHSAAALVSNGILYVAGGVENQSNSQDVPINTLETLSLK